MEQSPRPRGCYVPRRYLLVIMAHFGFAVVYALRVNLSVAIVAMVNSTYANAGSSAALDPECAKDDSGSKGGIDNGGEFNWDQDMQGLVLGSFFYGYLFTQIPGGIITQKFGGKWVFGLGVFSTAVLTMLTPLAARTSVYLLVGLRILEGFGEAVTYPAMHAILAHWAPPLERSQLIAIAHSGASVGTVISLPTSGLLCAYGFAGGWPSVFYVFGIVGVVWFLVWILFMHSYPETHPSISTEELDYIKRSQGHTLHNPKKKLRYPLKAMVKSKAVWAILITHFCNNWVFYTCLTSLPIYFQEVLNFSIKENGLLSALPYLLLAFVQVPIGYFADYLRSSWHISTIVTRKVFTMSGLLIPCVLLTSVSFIGCAHVNWAVAFMTLAVGLQGTVVGGFNVNHLDIAPNYAGFLLGVTNTIATIPGCVAPSVVGAFTENKPTRQQWQKVLFISSGLAFLGTVVFTTFGEGSEQPWNRDYESVDDESQSETRASVNASLDAVVT